MIEITIFLDPHFKEQERTYTLNVIVFEFLPKKPIVLFSAGLFLYKLLSNFNIPL